MREDRLRIAAAAHYESQDRYAWTLTAGGRGEGRRTQLVVLRELPPAPPARGRGGVQGRGRGEGDRFW